MALALRSPRLDDRIEVFERSDPGWRLPVALLCVVALLVLAVWAWSDDLSGRQVADDLPRIDLPSVADMDLPTAERTLEQLGFVVGVVARPNESVPKGTAFGQEPVAGAKLELGDRVSILVSDGPAGVVVPTVTGQQVVDAQALLAADGLNTEVTRVHDELIPQGEVFATVPAAGGRVPMNGTVKLTVSDGPAPRIVPSVVGNDLDHALAAIGRSGLAAGDITRKYTAGQPEGIVLSSDPPGGGEAPRGLPVKLVVTGPAPTVVVRSFTGLLQATATQVAKATGVTLSIVTRPVPVGDPTAGRVVAQGIPPYAEVPANTTVEVTVAVPG